MLSYLLFAAGELEELAASGEDHQRHLSIAQHGELESLLQEPASALREGDLAARGVLYAPHLSLPPHHLTLPNSLSPSRNENGCGSQL